MNRIVNNVLQLLVVFVKEGKLEFNARYNSSWNNSFPTVWFIFYTLCRKFSKIRFTRAGAREITIYICKIGYAYPNFYLQKSMWYNVHVCHLGYDFVFTGTGDVINDLCERLRCL